MVTLAERRYGARAALAAFGLPFAVWATVLLVPPTQGRDWEVSVTLAALAAAVTGLVLRSQRRRAPQRLLARTEEDAGVAFAVALGAVVPVAAMLTTDREVGPTEVVAAGTLTLVIMLAVHGVTRVVQRRGATAPASAERVVIVGVGPEAREVVELLEEQPDAGIRIIGVVGDRRVAEANGLAPMWLDDIDGLTEVMERHRGTSALVTATGFRGPSFRSITDAVLEAGHEVLVFNTVSRVSEGRVSVRSLMHEPLIAIRPHRVRAWTLAGKRGLDLVLASVLLVLTAPVLAAAALAVKLDDRGPVLYRQERIGRGGRPFTILKVRSMHVGADVDKRHLIDHNERQGPLFKMRDDPRVTRVGRVLRWTSIDELPQLVNVLRGDMSLVGPRPALPEEALAFDADLRARLRVRPGVTGLWQVEARTSPSFAAYQRLDLHYCENWTLGLDLRILLATVELILTELLIGLGSVLGLLRAPQPADATHPAGGSPSLHEPEPIGGT